MENIKIFKLYIYEDKVLKILTNKIKYKRVHKKG